VDYMYPDNLCESQNLFLFKECCAPEKIRGTSATGVVIVAMIEDVLREAEGEIENTQAVRKAIGATTAKMFKRRICQL